MSSGLAPARLPGHWHFSAPHELEATAVNEWKLTPFGLAIGGESTYTDQLVRCGLTTSGAAA